MRAVLTMWGCVRTGFLGTIHRFQASNERGLPVGPFLPQFVFSPTSLFDPTDCQFAAAQPRRAFVRLLHSAAAFSLWPSIRLLDGRRNSPRYRDRKKAAFCSCVHTAVVPHQENLENSRSFHAVAYACPIRQHAAGS